MVDRKQSSPQKLEVDSYIYWQGLTFCVKGLEGNGLLLNLQNTKTGESTVISLTEILGTREGYIYAKTIVDLHAKLEAQVTPVSVPPESALPHHFITLAERMIAVVERVQRDMNMHEQEIMERGQVAVLRDILTSEDIALSTYYKYRKTYQRHSGNAASIASAFHRKTFGKIQLSNPQQHFLDTLILRFPSLRVHDVYWIGKQVLVQTGGLWIDPHKCERHIPQDLIQELFDPKIPIEIILSNPEKMLLLTTVKYVSKSFFYDYHRGIRALPDFGKELVDIRYGKGAWDNQLRVFDSFVHKANQPLQYVFADHYLVDIFITDQETRSKPVRLWLTALICAFTRCVIGYALIPESPCIESIQNALFNAMLPKDFVQDWGISKQWLGHGIPVELSLDNAWAHQSKSLESLLRGLSNNGEFTRGELRLRPPYMARYGALIERFFGNLANRIKSYLNGKGAIQSQSPKDVRNAAREAHLLYEDIQRFILLEIVDYQNTPHRELNYMTPNEKWQEATSLWTPLVPACTPAVERLFWRDFNASRYLTAKGISAFGLTYSSPQLLKQPRYDRAGNRTQFSIRYDKADLSRIAIFRGERYICDAFANIARSQDGKYRSFSFAELEMVKEIQFSISGSRQIGDDLLNRLNQLGETSSKRQREQKEIQRMTKGVGQKQPEQYPSANEDVLKNEDRLLALFARSDSQKN